MPTFQEKYGLHLLLMATTIAMGTIAYHYSQQSQIIELTEQINRIEDEIPEGANYSAFARNLYQQEQSMKWRWLHPIILKDVASSIRNTGLQAQNFEIKHVDPKKPTNYYVATITAEDNVYKGWLQEEPIAKKVLARSQTMIEIRKPPASKTFKLEGLIDLPKLEKNLNAYKENALKNKPDAKGDEL